MDNKITISRSIDINTSANDLWSKTAEDFGGIDKWASTIAGVKITPSAGGEALGTERVCVSPFGDTREEMVAYDEEARHFAYTIAGMPPIVAQAANNWFITSKGDNQSAVEFRLEVEFTDEATDDMTSEFEQQIGGLLTLVGEELKHFVETGEPHPRKVEATQG